MHSPSPPAPVGNSACLAMDAAGQGTINQGNAATGVFEFTEKDEGIGKFVPLPRVTQPYRQRSKEVRG